MKSYILKFAVKSSYFGRASSSLVYSPFSTGAFGKIEWKVTPWRLCSKTHFPGSERRSSQHSNFSPMGTLKITLKLKG